MIRFQPTAGGIALVTPKGYEFLTYENGYTISYPQYSKIPRVV